MTLVQIERCVCGDGKVVGKPHHCYTAEDYKLSIEDFIEDKKKELIETQCSLCNNTLIRLNYQKNQKCDRCKKNRQYEYAKLRYWKQKALKP